MSCSQKKMPGVIQHVRIDPVMGKRLIELPVSLTHKRQGDHSRDWLGKRGNLEYTVKGCRISLFKIPVYHNLPYLSIFNNPYPNSGYPRESQPAIYPCLILLKSYLLLLGIDRQANSKYQKTKPCQAISLRSYFYVKRFNFLFFPAS